MKDDTKSNGEEISLQMVMDHMQYGFVRLDKRMGSLEGRIESLENTTKSLKQDMNKRFGDVDFALKRMYSNRLKDVERIERLEEEVFT